MKSEEYGFFLEVDDHRIRIKFFKDSDQNTNLGIQIFIWWWNSYVRFQGFDQNSFQDVDDHELIIKFFKDSDQNSGCHP